MQICGIECGVVVGAGLTEDFPTQPSLGFTENGRNKTKYPVSSSSLGDNVDVKDQGTITRLLQAGKKATVTQITTYY